MIDTIKDLLFGDYGIYLGFALFGSIILLIQLTMSVFGISGDSDVDGDGHVEFGEHADTGFGDFRFFSFRSIIAFVTFFGWGGVIAKSQDIHGVGRFLIALGCGLLMMLLTAIMLYFLLKMQHSGNVNPEDIVGSVGKVYLRIPGEKSKFGKVTAEVAGTTQEIVAIADEEIPRGVAVKVIKHIEERRFLVKKL